MQTSRMDRPRATQRSPRRTQEPEPRGQASVGEEDPRAHPGEVLLHGSGHVRSRFFRRQRRQPIEPQLEQLRAARSKRPRLEYKLLFDSHQFDDD